MTVTMSVQYTVRFAVGGVDGVPDEHEACVRALQLAQGDIQAEPSWRRPAESLVTGVGEEASSEATGSLHGDSETAMPERRHMNPGGGQHELLQHNHLVPSG